MTGGISAPKSIQKIRLFAYDSEVYMPVSPAPIGLTRGRGRGSTATRQARRPVEAKKAEAYGPSVTAIYRRAWCFLNRLSAAWKQSSIGTAVVLSLCRSVSDISTSAATHNSLALTCFVDAVNGTERREVNTNKRIGMMVW